MLNFINVYVLYGYKIPQNESFSKEKTKLKTLNKQMFLVLAYYDDKHMRVNYSMGLILKDQRQIAHTIFKPE